MTTSNNHQDVYYADYLQTKQLLSLQRPLSEAHDEMLFILNHQTHELWFKQILHEVDAVNGFLKKDYLPEEELSYLVSSLKRIERIIQALIQQMSILETMSPMDFLEFRHILSPASGFQSLQFRALQIKLGSPLFRRFMSDKMFNTRLRAQDKQALEELIEQPSLFSFIERWLERMPYTSTDSFDYWQDFKQHMKQMLKNDQITIKNNPTLTAREKEAELANLLESNQMFELLFDEQKYRQLQANHKRRLSRKATLSALFILLNRDLPLLHNPYQVITSLINIDQLFYSWRQGHALLAQRMLGTKIGTGGSSGHQYLKNSADSGRLFTDFAELSTFLVPRSQLPELPEALKKRMTFNQ